MKKRLVVNFLLILAFFILLALFLSSDVYFLNLSQKQKVAYWPFLLFGLLRWVPWAFFALPVAWLGRRFPLREKKWLPMIPLHFGAASCFAILHSALAWASMYVYTHWLGGNGLESYPFLSAISDFLHFDLLTYWIIVAVTYMLDYYRCYRERELLASQLETKLAQANLQVLQNQIHPHFLFNTLHAISVLVHRDPEAADRMINHLSELLRFSLDQSDSQEIPLKMELEILAKYLLIMQTRFGERLVVGQSIQAEVQDAWVPRFILQPLVENSIRHGIAPYKAGGSVHVSAFRRDSLLILQVRDSGPGMSEPLESNLNKGFGLANTKARLRQLYGEAGRMEISGYAGGGTTVTLEIPWHIEALPRPATER